MSSFRLNLATANRVFIVEPQWNPSVENQAIARALRLGQKQAVLVTRYVMEQTVEQVSRAKDRIDRVLLTSVGYARIARYQTGEGQSHSKWLMRTMRVATVASAPITARLPVAGHTSDISFDYIISVPGKMCPPRVTLHRTQLNAQ